MRHVIKNYYTKKYDIYGDCDFSHEILQYIFDMGEKIGELKGNIHITQSILDKYGKEWFPESIEGNITFLYTDTKLLKDISTELIECNIVKNKKNIIKFNNCTINGFSEMDIKNDKYYQFINCKINSFEELNNTSIHIINSTINEDMFLDFSGKLHTLKIDNTYITKIQDLGNINVNTIKIANNPISNTLHIPVSCAKLEISDFQIPFININEKSENIKIIINEKTYNYTEFRKLQKYKLFY